MPAGQVLTDDIKQLIASIYLKDKTAPAKIVLAKVHERLRRTDWPRLSVIQREVKKIRDNDEKITENQLDVPWHIGLMNKYDISPEVVPYILIVQRWLEEYPDPYNNPPPQPPLTIRQALWVVRLSGVVKDIRQAKLKELPHIAHLLFSWADAYARRERICEMSGTPFDTSEFDKGIREQGFPITVDKTTIITYPDKSFRIDTIDKGLQETMERMNKEGEK